MSKAKFLRLQIVLQIQNQKPPQLARRLDAGPAAARSTRAEDGRTHLQHNVRHLKTRTETALASVRGLNLGTLED